MDFSPITNRLSSAATYLKNEAKNILSNMPARDQIISSIGQLALNKYAQTLSFGTVAVAVGAYKTYKDFQQYKAFNTHTDQDKPVMETISVQEDVITGEVHIKEAQVQQRITSTLENGESHIVEIPLYETIYSGSTTEFLKKNWKAPLLATIALVATVARIII